MAHSENLGLGKTHKPKLVTLFLKQMAYVPLAPFYLASKFFLHSPNARNIQARVLMLSSRQTTCGEICFCINEWFILVVTLVRLQISHIQFEMTGTITDFLHPVWNDSIKQKTTQCVSGFLASIISIVVIKMIIRKRSFWLLYVFLLV